MTLAFLLPAKRVIIYVHVMADIFAIKCMV